MPILEITLDLTQFHQRVEQSKQALRRDVEAATQAAAIHGRDRAKEGKWKDQTGKLRATISSSNVGWSGAIYWSEFRTNQPYAPFVENDTRPHVIEPRGQGYPLHWTGGRYGPGDHYAFVVHHPGTTGFGFMRTAEGWARNFLVKELSYRLPNLIGVWR